MKGRFDGARSEAGETLVETLLTVMILGIIVAGIIGTMGTLLLGSKAHRDQADANSELVAAMEEIKAKSTARDCPPVDGADGNTTPPDGYDLSAHPGVSFSSAKPVQYQVVGGSAYDWSDDESACDLSSPLTLQLITLTYTEPNSDASPELSFVKGEY